MCITESHKEHHLGWLNRNRQFYHNLGQFIMLLSILEISSKAQGLNKPKIWPTAWSTCKPGLMPTQDLNPNNYGFITKGKSRYTFPIYDYCAFCVLLICPCILCKVSSMWIILCLFCYIFVCDDLLFLLLGHGLTFLLFVRFPERRGEISDCSFTTFDLKVVHCTIIVKE